MVSTIVYTIIIFALIITSIICKVKLNKYLKEKKNKNVIENFLNDDIVQILLFTFLIICIIKFLIDPLFYSIIPVIGGAIALKGYSSSSNSSYSPLQYEEKQTGGDDNQNEIITKSIERRNINSIDNEEILNNIKDIVTMLELLLSFISKDSYEYIIHHFMFNLFVIL